ncbi:MAG TPA: folylpolyglutamate synthase/dihydrofolate synthase family protein [Thermoplasmata archaeon]|nr:folylpolyglutamate synthase/dihydrofolate synthase family protein [Thermoplasmata archaeon]
MATLRAALDRLYQRRRFGLRPGLDVVRALLGALDHPERTFPAIHVTGSKGKGSVAAMAEAILSASGLKTGLFTSPHLQSFRERIRIGREPIPPDALVVGLDRVEHAAAELERTGAIDRAPTFFEVTTAVAFDWFRRESVDAAVVEVGIGGRLDSTNVLAGPVGVVTTVELEHTDLLGPTRAAIAREKAGILHAGMHAIAGALPDEARTEVDRVAREVGAPIWHLDTEIRVGDRTLSPRGQTFDVEFPTRRLARLRLPLLGTFQPGNAALAVAAVDRFAHATGRPVPDRAVRRGLANVRWRGRVERVARRPDLYVDAAHTPDSAVALAQSLAEVAPFAAPEGNVVLFGCLAEKRLAPMLDALAPLAHTVVLVPVPSDRAAPVEEMRRVALGRFRRIVVAPDVARGLSVARAATAADGLTVAAGSDYLVGAILDVLEGSPADEPDLSDPGRAPPPRSAP